MQVRVIFVNQTMRRKFKNKIQLTKDYWLVVVTFFCFLTVQYTFLRFSTSTSCQTIQTNVKTEIISTGNGHAQTVEEMSVITSTNSTINSTIESTPHLHTIYIITATYPRAQQIAELTRLSQTLMLVPNIKWLVIEDASTKTKAVEELLLQSGIPFVHLLAPMPEQYRLEQSDNSTITSRRDLSWSSGYSSFGRYKGLPRGVSNRNAGLKWLRRHATTGVFYFADDDNSYDIRLFEQMRTTEIVSMWPVGLLKGGFSSPIIRDGEFDGFYTGWTGGRTYQVDMAGFAVSVKHLLQRPLAWMPYLVGYEEEVFLTRLEFTNKDIQFKAWKCTKILVWHTQTLPPIYQIPMNDTLYKGTNIEKLVKTI